MANYLIGTYKMSEEEIAKMKSDAEKRESQAGSTMLTLMAISNANKRQRLQLVASQSRASPFL